RINLGTAKLNRSDGHPLAQERSTKRRPVTQPFREGAPLGKLHYLSLEVNHMDRLLFENGAASDTPTGARHSVADFLRRNWAEVRGHTQVLSVDLEDSHVIGSPEARRALDDHVKHGLELRRRGADDP